MKLSLFACVIDHVYLTHWW